MRAVGAVREQVWTVKACHLASAFGSGLVDVLATPVLVGFCEECARGLVDPELPEGQKTVGTAITLEHLAATPVGFDVTVTAELIEIDRRRLRFRVQARDPVEMIARGTHDRFIVDTARFEAHIRTKAAQSRSRIVESSQSGESS